MDFEANPNPRCTNKCSYPKIIDPLSCECICPRVVSCINNQIFDSTICQCTDLHKVDFIPRFPCQMSCVPPRSHLNLFDCKCECPPTITCPPYQILNQNTCECQSLDIATQPPQCLLLCIGNWTFNAELCKCECIDLTCPFTQFADQETCECKNRGLVDLPQLCIKRCPLGSSLDIRECECKPFVIRPNLPFCDLRCPPGFTLIREICQCIASNIRSR